MNCQHIRHQCCGLCTPKFWRQECTDLAPSGHVIRRSIIFLRFFMTLPWSAAVTSQGLSSDHYTIHGLKCTLLSWACQLGLSEEDRRQHGKHKPAQQSVSLYSRDDVVGSLRLQQQLVEQICRGWRPCTPLARGGQQPMIEPQFQLERFRKETGALTWKFFQFDRVPSFAADQDSTGPEPHDLGQDSGSESSDSSSSSNSSSDTETGDNTMDPSSKKRRVQPSADKPAIYAFGLHRITWHVIAALFSRPWCSTQLAWVSLENSLWALSAEFEHHHR